MCLFIFHSSYKKDTPNVFTFFVIRNRSVRLGLFVRGEKGECDAYSQLRTLPSRTVVQACRSPSAHVPGRGNIQPARSAGDAHISLARGTRSGIRSSQKAMPGRGRRTLRPGSGERSIHAREQPRACLDRSLKNGRKTSNLRERLKRSLFSLALASQRPTKDARCHGHWLPSDQGANEQTGRSVRRRALRQKHHKGGDRLGSAQPGS